MGKALGVFGDYLGIGLGSCITAAGLDLFLVPNRLNDGGLAGVAVVLHYVAQWPVGFTLLALNVPLLLISTWVVGLPFGVKTVFGVIALSLALQLLPEHAVTHDLLLASVYGGVLSGTGLGLVFRFGGSTGGTDLVARLIRHFLHFSMGQGLLGVDFLVIGLTGLVFGAHLAMYSLFALFIGTRVIDLVQEGMDYQKAAWIICANSADLASQILTVLGRGVTSLSGTGMYTGTTREVLLVVVSRLEVARLKAMVYHHDPAAFLMITDAHEVLGEGFKGRPGQV